MSKTSNLLSCIALGISTVTAIAVGALLQPGATPEPPKVYAPALLSNITAWADSEPWYSFIQGGKRISCQSLRVDAPGRGFGIRFMETDKNYDIAFQQTSRAVAGLGNCWVRDKFG